MRASRATRVLTVADFVDSAAAAGVEPAPCKAASFGTTILHPDEAGADGVVDVTETLDGGVLKRVFTPGESTDTPQAGTTCQLNYVGYVNGKEFDRNHGGYPFEFVLGDRKVVPGWEVGVAAMKVGEHAQLTLASAYGYGENGDGEDIPPGSTLVFDVALVGLKHVVGSGKAGEEERSRLEALRAERESLAAQKDAEKKQKEQAKADAQAKLQAKLAAKNQKGKGGGKGKKGK